MKSEYRQAVESVMEQAAKMAEVTKLHAEAAARQKHLSEALRLNQEALDRYERRVAELELELGLRLRNDRSAESGVHDEIKEINASLKFLCRELMRPEA